MSAWMNGRFLRSESAHANPLFGHTVVLAELSQGSISQLVGPRVADVKERRRSDAVAISRQSHRDHRRAHAEVLGVLARVGENRQVRLVDRVVQAFDGGAILEAQLDHLDGHRRGHFTGGVTPHTIGH